MPPKEKAHVCWESGLSGFQSISIILKQDAAQGQVHQPCLHVNSGRPLSPHCHVHSLQAQVESESQRPIGVSV